MIISRMFACTLIALILFTPIMGLRLEGFEVSVALLPPVLFSCSLGLLYGLFLWLKTRPWFSERWTRLTAGPAYHTYVARPPPYQTPLLVTLLVLMLALPFVLGKYWLSVAILVLIYVLLGLGLNIVVGLAGLLDLGFVAFYAVGAYGYALSAQYWGLGFWSALPLCALMAGVFGAVLAFPILRMHGDYLAIVTLGFGEIIRLVLNNWASFTGGPNGISAPPLTFLGIEFTRRAKQGGITLHDWIGGDYNAWYRYLFLYLVLFFFVCLMIRLVWRLKDMPIGRAWEALREDEIATRALGIYHVTTKLSAFSLGAMVGGIGGVFFAAHQGFINPSSFTFIESALILTIVVLGGMGSIAGVIIAATVLTLLPELLRDFAEYRMLGFGILMVLMMIWRPRGLLRVRRRYIPRPEAS